jgi:zinc transport system substrate-binding protein
MKKIFFLILSIISITFFVSCKKNEKYEICVSSYPIYDLTKKVCGDKLNVLNIVPNGVEPHEYEPTIKDRVALEDAKLFFTIGLNFEHYTKNLPQSIIKKTIEVTKNIEIIKSDDSSDPHVWLSPINAIIMLENIKNSVIEIDLENKDYYIDNFNTYKEKLINLDNLYKEGLNDIKRKDIVTSHKAFSYLCKEYNLNQISISGLSPEEEPTQQDIKRITDFIKEHDVKTIFFEELSSSKASETIANETGCQYDVLSPLEGITNETDDYISVMENNLKKLIKALK